MNVDDVGRSLYLKAGLDECDPPDDGAVEIAVRIHGPDVIHLQTRAMLEASVALVRGSRRIIIRDGIAPQRANYLVAQMLGRIELAELGVQSLDEERAVGAWLTAPPVAFRARLHQVGLDLRALAAMFVITQTSAAMRIAEVGGPSTVVATPDRIHRRGTLLRGFSDESVRELAAKSNPRSVRKVQIRDEPGRVALLARA